MFSQLQAPKRQQQLLSARRAGDEGQRRPTGGRRGRPLEQWVAAAAGYVPRPFWRSPMSWALVIGLFVLRCRVMHDLASCPTVQRVDRQLG